MVFDPRTTTLDQFEAPEFRIECRSCRRSGVVKRADMIRRFGAATTLQECARQAAALKGCTRASSYGIGTCSVLVAEVPAWTWASLMNARIGGWRAFLTCHRRFAALKKVDSCSELVELDVLSLIATLGDNFPLEKLPRRCKCPQCGTSHIDIDWYVPEVAPAQKHLAPAPEGSWRGHHGALTVEEEEFRTGKAPPAA